MSGELDRMALHAMTKLNDNINQFQYLNIRTINNNSSVLHTLCGIMNSHELRHKYTTIRIFM